MLNYRSLADLNATIKSNLHRIPRDIDIIAGIPRSGLLAANILSLDRHLPLTDIEGLIAGRFMNGGHRMADNQTPNDVSHPKKVLVVDDSINTGREITQVKERLKSANLPHQLVYSAVYGSNESQQLVDLCLEVVPSPRIFQWNIMHHSKLAKSCVDIDGVLCRDPTEEENDDGPKYEEFLKNAEPMFLPSKPIGWLVTCRLEKYRQLTEQWLQRYDIEYQNLVMMDLPSKEARVADGSHGSFKAEIFANSKAVLFIESSAKQAQEIFVKTGKPVFCLETGKMLPFVPHVGDNNSPLQELADQVEMLRGFAALSDKKIQNLKSQIAQKSREISNIKNSTAWKVASALQKLRGMAKFRRNAESK